MAKTTKRDQLTRCQRHLVSEIEEIASLLKLDYVDIKSYERAARMPLLEMMRRKIIISEVITIYTLTDEHLNLCLCHYFFGRKEASSSCGRPNAFNYHVLEELPLMAKLRFAKSISKVPKAVAADIERLNALPFCIARH
jgi:hypothetical protein